MPMLPHHDTPLKGSLSKLQTSIIFVGGEGAHVKANKECISKAAFAKVNLSIDYRGESAVSKINPRPTSRVFSPG